MLVKTTMKELCRECKHFDESKVAGERYHCPKLNMTIWYEIDYMGCGAFQAKKI